MEVPAIACHLAHDEEERCCSLSDEVVGEFRAHEIKKQQESRRQILCLLARGRGRGSLGTSGTDKEEGVGENEGGHQDPTIRAEEAPYGSWLVSS